MIPPINLCALVMKTDVLLKRAVVSLMDLEHTLEVVVSEAADYPEFALDISKIKPQVVLFSESHPLAAEESLSQLLINRGPGFRIVVVSVNSNWPYIFNKEDKLMTSLDDLLTVIKAD